MNRSGNRIDTAKAIFGRSGSSSKSDDASTSLEESPSPKTPALAPAAAERLNILKVQDMLVSNLLDFYLGFTKDHPSLIEATNFRVAWFNAHHQASNLDDQSQVLCAVLLALSARTSDHPLIVGAGAPRISSLAALAVEGRDLSLYGQRRVAACRVLTERAIKVADEKNIWRIPSVESIAALTLLEGLVNVDEGRSYSNAYNWTCSSHAGASAKKSLPVAWR